MDKESKIIVAQQDYSGDTGLTWGAMPPASRSNLGCSASSQTSHAAPVPLQHSK